MEERREIERIKYIAKSVIVDCETSKKYYVNVNDISPIGMGITAPGNVPCLVGKDVIVVADTMIMYADVVRQEENPDGTVSIGVHARKFTDDVLKYILDRIGE